VTRGSCLGPGGVLQRRRVQASETRASCPTRLCTNHTIILPELIVLEARRCTSFAVSNFLSRFARSASFIQDSRAFPDGFRVFLRRTAEISFFETSREGQSAATAMCERVCSWFRSASGLWTSGASVGVGASDAEALVGLIHWACTCIHVTARQSISSLSLSSRRRNPDASDKLNPTSATADLIVYSLLGCWDKNEF
jgi:hypothetical protein